MSAISLTSSTILAVPQAGTAPPVARRLLGELRRGEMGVVLEVAVDPADERRLKSLGICAGRTLQVVSPGSPLIVRVLGTRVGLSSTLARRVIVQAC